MRSIYPLLLSLILGLGLATPALALSVSEAKDAGLVGEQADGYLASVHPNPSSEVQALIHSTNLQRHNLYQQGAEKAGVTLEIMEKRAAQRLLQKATPGHYFRSPDGRWQKK